MSVAVTIEIPIEQIEASLARGRLETENRLIKATEKILDLIAAEQILAYTSSNNPAPPAGTKYRRTFDLQKSSETQIINRKLPIISGIWRANEEQVKYARYVLGARSQQAKIHRGRWKSTNEVAKNINDMAPAIVEENLR